MYFFADDVPLKFNQKYGMLYPNCIALLCSLEEIDRAVKMVPIRNSVKKLSKREIQDRFVHKLKKEKVWLGEVNSQSLLASLGNLYTAFISFFKDKTKFLKTTNIVKERYH